MSTNQDTQDNDLDVEETAGKSHKGLILGAVVVGIGLGAWQGAPRLAPRMAPCAAEAGPVWAAIPLPFGGGDGHGGGHGDDGSGERFFQFDDLILNPAGTDGTRFLVLSLALEMKEDAGLAALEARDPEVRDAILSLLSTKTVQELADVTQRPALREELRQRLNQLLGEDEIVRLYLPRFVIQ
ncbi:flagellar basal body-associated FliL family protein [Gemmatimonadota bacterium DH-20]|uniref:Flagellar protein FliL n=1 Tax=Gaopeijia maritima TaxID=3119007 RepID=A0ABU9EEK7_9BACT